MAIQKTTGFKASDGVVYGTVEAAQQAELAALCKDYAAQDIVAVGLWFAKQVMENADAILSILTTGPKSRPNARKSKATSNPKRAAAKATPKQAQEGFREMREAANGAAPVGHNDVYIAGAGDPANAR